MRIQGKTALIAGGASGLGAATARMIVDAGGRVIIADLKSGADLGSSALYHRVDVTEARQVQAAISAAIERFGRLDVLVNCAGVADPGKVAGKEGPMPLEAFTRIVSINLIGAFNTLRLAAAAMISNHPDDQGERGVIVNTASIAAFEGQIGQAAYAASKGGIVSMTLPVARELARHGIRVMTIAPGVFDTPLMAALPEPARVSLGQSVPFPARLGRPEEFAQLVRQIVENPMLNGSVIRLDGALRMGPR